MNKPIKCYICHRSGVDLFWINGLQEFMCWHCIAAAVVVLARETAPSNNGVQPTAELAGSQPIAADPTTARQPAAADA